MTHNFYTSTLKNFYLTAVFLFGFSGIVNAQQWIQTRGPGGGDVIDMLEKNGTILAATIGGIFRSTDNGDTWVNSGNGLPGGVFLEKLAATGNYIYGANYSTGLYKSADNGATWTHIDLQVLNIFITQLFASHDTLYVGCEGCGVYRSVNEAASFQVINNGFPGSAFVFSFVQIGPYLYTGLRGNGGTPGVYRTPVNSINWTQVINASVIDMAVKGGDILMTGGTFDSLGLFRSTDLGNTWADQTPVLPPAEVPTFLAVAGNTIYFGTSGDAPYRSIDNGITWERSNSGLKPLAVFSLLAGSAGVFVGYERGVARTTDNGASWQRKSVGLTATSITSLYADGSTALYATGRTATVGSSDGVFYTTDEGQNWTAIDQGLLPNPQVNTLTKSNGNIIIGTDNYGLYIKTPADTAFRRAGGIPDLIAVLSLVSVGQHVIAGIDGNEELYRSDDNGLTWVQSNNGFSADITDQISALYEKSGVIYAGGFDALYKSTDFGVNWTMSKTGIYPGSIIRSITSLGNDLYVCTTSGIYKSSNNGGNWVQVVISGLPPVSELTEITSANGNLYIACDIGVIKGEDSGRTWTVMNDGLLHYKNSLSLEVFNNKLFLGTDQTAVWKQGLVTSLPAVKQKMHKISMTVSPNPSSVEAIVNILTDTQGKASITAYDTEGRIAAVLYSGEIHTPAFSAALNLSQLEKGTYILRLTINNESVGEKIVIQ